MMITPNNLEGPVKFFAENRAAHVTAVFGAALSGVWFGVRGVRAQGWQRAGWFVLCALQMVQVGGLIRLRRVDVHAISTCNLTLSPVQPTSQSAK